MKSLRNSGGRPTSKDRYPQIQTWECHLRNYVTSLHYHQVMRKQEVNLMKVRETGTKAKIRPKFDLTLSGKQRENCKAVLCKSEWFYDEHDQTATTTIINNNNNKINKTSHPARCLAVTE